MNENQYPPTKPVCQLDADNLYLHQTVADLDPLAADGSYLLPAGFIDTQPPETRAGYAAKWLPEKGEWQYLPDHRGKTAYRTADGAEVQVEQVGELPGGLTFTPRENEYQTWDEKAKAWVLTKEGQSQLLAEAVDKGTEAINDAVEQAYHHVPVLKPNISCANNRRATTRQAAVKAMCRNKWRRLPSLPGKQPAKRPTSSSPKPTTCAWCWANLEYCGCGSLN